jgi:hypothetical protein
MQEFAEQVGLSGHDCRLLLFDTLYEKMITQWSGVHVYLTDCEEAIQLPVNNVAQACPRLHARSTDRYALSNERQSYFCR